MPSGKTHDRITLWSLPWIVVLTILTTRSGELALIVGASFLFSGLMFGPDLDIYSIQFKRWGYLRYLWLPYQKLLRHRSVFSHGIIIGTVGRLIYLGICIAIVGIFATAIAQLIWGFTWNWQTFTQNSVRQIINVYPDEAIAAFVGLELGSLSHSLSDFVGSAYKRWQKNGLTGIFPKSKGKQKKRRKSSRRRK